MNLKTLIAPALLAGALTANAADYAMAPLSLTAESGSTAELSINMTNGDLEVVSFQLDLYLPTGVTVVEDEYNTPIATLAADRIVDHIVNAAVQTDAAVRYLSYSNNNRVYKGSDGVIITTPVKIDVEPGTYEIVIRNSSFTHAEDFIEFFPPEATATLTVTAPEVKRYGDNQIYATDVTINEGENAQLLVGYNSLTDLYAYSADITLPEGVTVTNVEYYEVLTDQSYTTNWSFADGVLSLTGEQTGTVKKPKPSEAGDHLFACVSLNTSALAAGTYNITVGNQYISNEDEEEDGEHSPEAYTAVLTVTGGTSTPTEQYEAPEISVNSDGNIVVTSATKGAKIHTTITSEDIDSFHHENGEPLEMTGQYRITSYATADGYAASEPTTAMLVWTKKQVATDVEILEAAADRAIIIYSVGENIFISGVDVNESISIYSLGGELLFKGEATENPFVVPVSLSKGTVYIVTVDADSFKYVL